MDNMIEVTGVDLIKLVKEVYNLSKPAGMGFLHATGGELSDEEANDCISNDNDPTFRIYMDYVNGRQCKFQVYKRDGKLFILDRWYDHTPAQLEELLRRVGLRLTVCRSDEPVKPL